MDTVVFEPHSQNLFPLMETSHICRKIAPTVLLSMKTKAAKATLNLDNKKLFYTLKKNENTAKGQTK